MGMSNKYVTGEVARAKVLEYLRQAGGGVSGDSMIRWLQAEGYIVVPRPSCAPTPRGARRGKVKEVPSPWLGKSHTARLAGQ